MDAKGILMHIDRADEVAMEASPALAARPISSFGLVFVLASGTPTTRSSFGAGEAQDASLLAFMREVVDIASVFPLRHAAIVVSTRVLIADAMRVADEERPHSLLDAEVDHLPGGLVPQVADASLGPATDFVLRALQLLPAARVLLAPALLSGELAELPASLPFERANTAPGHDQRLARVGGHGSEVDFP